MLSDQSGIPLQPARQNPGFYMSDVQMDSDQFLQFAGGTFFHDFSSEFYSLHIS